MNDILSAFITNSVTSINEFYVQSVPTIEVLTHMILKSKIRTILINKIPLALHEIIGGERGAGKSTTLLYLRDYVEKSKELCKDEVFTYYSSSWKEFSNLYGFINLLRNLTNTTSKGQDPPKKRPEIVGYISKFLENKRIFIFIDVPDTKAPRRTDIFYNFAETIELVYGVQNLSFFMAFNPSFFSKFDEISDIVGKYCIPSNTPTNWVSSFSLEQTKNFILNRLNKNRNQSSNDLYPFTQESVTIIYQFSKGIPRNILTCCSTLLHFVVEGKIKIINKTIAEQILKEEFSKNVTKERIEDKTERESLNKIYDIINKIFDGKVSSEQELFDYIKTEEKEVKNRITLRKYLFKLEKLGLVDMRRNPEERFKKMIRTKW